MEKKSKKTKKDPESNRRPRGEVPDPAHLLRELYERGWAEIEERRKIDPNYR